MKALHFVRLGHKTILLPTRAYLHLADWVHHPADYYELDERCYPLPRGYRPMRYKEFPWFGDLIFGVINNDLGYYNWQMGWVSVTHEMIYQWQTALYVSFRNEIDRRTIRPIVRNGRLT